VLTQTQKRDFDRDGVVCVRGALSRDEVARLARAIDRAVAGIGSTPTGYDITAIADAVWEERRAHIDARAARQYNLDGLAALVQATEAKLLRDRPAPASPKGGRFLVETGVWTRCDDMREVALTSALARIAGILLDARHIRFYDDQIFVKEPGTVDRTAFHQDLGYFHIEGDQGCVVWAPVDRASRETGAVGYVRGSHKWGTSFKPNVFMSRLAMPAAEGDELPDIDNHEDDYDIVYFDLEPGDVVIHHFRTVHGSHGNASTALTRRAASLRYVGERVRYHTRPGAPAQPHRPLDWPDGAELRDPWFPLVWRRASAAAAAE
jgi:hypothetical protein